MPRNNPQAPLVTGPLLRITLVNQAQNGLNEFSCDYSLPTAPIPTIVDLQNFGTAWNTANLASMLACFAADITFVQFRVAELKFGSVPTYATTYVGGTIGTVVGISINSIIAATAKKLSGLRGQHGRGRWSFGPVPESFVSASSPNDLSAAAITAYGAFLANLVLPVTTSLGAWVPIVLSRPVPPATIYTQGTQLTFTVLNKVFGTVRRRKEGLGI